MTPRRSHSSLAWHSVVAVAADVVSMAVAAVAVAEDVVSLGDDDGDGAAEHGYLDRWTFQPTLAEEQRTDWNISLAKVADERAKRSCYCH